MDIKFFTLFSFIILFSFSKDYSADASDGLCANPQSIAEQAICEDEYLMGLNLQINNILYEFIAYRAGTEELPEAQQVEYGHYWIGLEDCEGHFRCMESEMKGFLKQMEDFYLDDEDTVLTSGLNVPFILFQSQDSPGWDIAPVNETHNYGWTERFCQLRCAANDECIAVGFSPIAQVPNDPFGAYGYCTMKKKAVFPLTNWRADGVFLLKRQ